MPASLNNKKIIFGLQETRKNDTILIKNNAFSVKGLLNEPSKEAYLLLLDRRSQKYFVIDSGKNYITFNEVPPNSITKQNKLSAAESINSKSNLLKEKLSLLIYEDYLEQQKIENINSDSLTRQRIKRLRTKELKLVPQFPDTYYSLITLHNLSRSSSLDPNELLTVYNNLDNVVKETKRGKELKEELLNYYTLEPGNTVRSFSAFTPEGLIFTNTSLKSSVYLLAFGATWCVPCKGNIPMLKRIYDKFHDKGFTVVYVNLDGREDVWKKQVKNYAMNWINVSDNRKWRESELAKAFNISAIPLYFIIDQNQKIVYNSRSRLSPRIGYTAIEAIVTRLLK